MHKYSTGALTEEQKIAQNEMYSEKHKYDYVIIGTGVSALAVGALLANAGKKVCLLEAHDSPGGYAHTFEMNHFYFCAQVHYIWGCAPGQMVYEFLRHLGLQEEIQFNAFDSNGYDLMSMPDGKRVRIPYGFENVVKNIDEAYPGRKENLEKFFQIMQKLEHELVYLPENGSSFWHYLIKAPKLINLFRYKDKTLQQVFDECGLSPEMQAVLNANTGDLLSPPKELSFFAYQGLMSGYNKGAYYPKKHFKFFIERLARYITDHQGCHIFYETEVNQITLANDKVSQVSTKDGKVFRADSYICNMDPQKASYLIGRDKFPSKFLDSLSYTYSPSSFIIYLGIKDMDLRDYGFGNYNIWHLEQWDINKAWEEMRRHSFQQPWIFYSTPTLHTSEKGIAPDGCQILEIATATEYKYFKKWYDQDPHEYRVEKKALADRLLEITEERFIPHLSRHIALKVIGSPVSSETFCFAPFGNSYGSVMTPNNMGIGRLGSQTPWDNFFWCNASSGYASVYGTITTGATLYMKLTGDDFYDFRQAPCTEEAIKYASANQNL